MSDQNHRIAKVIARSGLCSRRDAEVLIFEGRVKVNGEIILSPALNVDHRAAITVDNKPLPRIAQAQLWRYHKPRGVLTTHRDPQGRPTLFSILPPDMPRVISVGRLDFDSEGLILLTNDGEIARQLELPSNGWERVYRVKVQGNITAPQLQALKEGVTIDHFNYQPIAARLDKAQNNHSWLTLTLHEGKNREIRKIMEHLGYRVARLIRIKYGPYVLGDLPMGHVALASIKQMR